MLWLGMPRHKSIHAAQEALYAFNSFILPVKIALRGRGKQAVQTGGIGTVAGYHLVRSNHVPKALGHLGAVFDHHALSEQAFDGLIILYESEVAHALGPEARIDQVENGVLHASNVLVNGKPISNGFAGERRFV